MNAVYELVYIGYDDMYFTIGLFKTFAECDAVMNKAIESGGQLAHDAEDHEEIQIIEYKFGAGDDLRKTLKTINRESYYIEGDDEDIYRWQVV